MATEVDIPEAITKEGEGTYLTTGQLEPTVSQCSAVQAKSSEGKMDQHPETVKCFGEGESTYVEDKKDSSGIPEGSDFLATPSHLKFDEQDIPDKENQLPSGKEFVVVEDAGSEEKDTKGEQQIESHGIVNRRILSEMEITEDEDHMVEAVEASKNKTELDKHDQVTSDEQDSINENPATVEKEAKSSHEDVKGRDIGDGNAGSSKEPAIQEKEEAGDSLQKEIQEKKLLESPLSIPTEEPHLQEVGDPGTFEACPEIRSEDLTKESPKDVQNQNETFHETREVINLEQNFQEEGREEKAVTSFDITEDEVPEEKVTKILKESEVAGAGESTTREPNQDVETSEEIFKKSVVKSEEGEQGEGNNPVPTKDFKEDDRDESRIAVKVAEDDDQYSDTNPVVEGCPKVTSNDEEDSPQALEKDEPGEAHQHVLNVMPEETKTESSMEDAGVSTCNIDDATIQSISESADKENREETESTNNAKESDTAIDEVFETSSTEQETVEHALREIHTVADPPQDILDKEANDETSQGDQACVEAAELSTGTEEKNFVEQASGELPTSLEVEETKEVQKEDATYIMSPEEEEKEVHENCNEPTEVTRRETTEDITEPNQDFHGPISEETHTEESEKTIVQSISSFSEVSEAEIEKNIQEESFNSKENLEKTIPPIVDEHETVLKEAQAENKEQVESTDVVPERTDQATIIPDEKTLVVEDTDVHAEEKFESKENLEEQIPTAPDEGALLKEVEAEYKEQIRDIDIIPEQKGAQTILTDETSLDVEDIDKRAEENFEQKKILEEQIPAEAHEGETILEVAEVENKERIENTAAVPEDTDVQAENSFNSNESLEKQISATEDEYQTSLKQAEAENKEQAESTGLSTIIPDDKSLAVEDTYVHTDEKLESKENLEEEIPTTEKFESKENLEEQIPTETGEGETFLKEAEAENKEQIENTNTAPEDIFVQAEASFNPEDNLEEQIPTATAEGETFLKKGLAENEEQTKIADNAPEDIYLQAEESFNPNENLEEQTTPTEGENGTDLKEFEAENKEVKIPNIITEEKDLVTILTDETSLDVKDSDLQAEENFQSTKNLEEQRPAEDEHQTTLQEAEAENKEQVENPDITSEEKASPATILTDETFSNLEDSDLPAEENFESTKNLDEQSPTTEDEHETSLTHAEAEDKEQVENPDIISDEKGPESILTDEKSLDVEDSDLPEKENLESTQNLEEQIPTTEDEGKTDLKDVAVESKEQIISTDLIPEEKGPEPLLANKTSLDVEDTNVQAKESFESRNDLEEQIPNAADATETFLKAAEAENTDIAPKDKDVQSEENSNSEENLERQITTKEAEYETILKEDETENKELVENSDIIPQEKAPATIVTDETSLNAEYTDIQEGENFESKKNFEEKIPAEDDEGETLLKEAEEESKEQIIHTDSVLQEKGPETILTNERPLDMEQAEETCESGNDLEEQIPSAADQGETVLKDTESENKDQSNSHIASEEKGLEKDAKALEFEDIGVQAGEIFNSSEKNLEKENPTAAKEGEIGLKEAEAESHEEEKSYIAPEEKVISIDEAALVSEGVYEEAEESFSTKEFTDEQIPAGADEDEKKIGHGNVISSGTDIEVYNTELIGEKTVEENFQVQSHEEVESKLGVEDETSKLEDHLEKNNMIAEEVLEENFSSEEKLEKQTPTKAEEGEIELKEAKASNEEVKSYIAPEEEIISTVDLALVSEGVYVEAEETFNTKEFVEEQIPSGADEDEAKTGEGNDISNGTPVKVDNTELTEEAEPKLGVEDESSKSEDHPQKQIAIVEEVLDEPKITDRGFDEGEIIEGNAGFSAQESIEENTVNDLQENEKEIEHSKEEGSIMESIKEGKGDNLAAEKSTGEITEESQTAGAEESTCEANEIAESSKEIVIASEKASKEEDINGDTLPVKVTEEGDDNNGANGEEGLPQAMQMNEPGEELEKLQDVTPEETNTEPSSEKAEVPCTKEERAIQNIEETSDKEKKEEEADPINNTKEDDTTMEEVFEIASIERETEEQALQETHAVEDHAREFNDTETTEENSTKNQVSTEAADLSTSIVEKNCEEQASHSSSLVGEDTTGENSKQEEDYVVNMKEEEEGSNVESTKEGNDDDLTAECIPENEKQDAVKSTGEITEESQTPRVGESTTCEADVIAEISEDNVGKSEVKYEGEQIERNSQTSEKISEEDRMEEAISVKVAEEGDDDNNDAVTVIETSANVNGEEGLPRALQMNEQGEELEKLQDVMPEETKTESSSENAEVTCTKEETAIQNTEETSDKEKKKEDTDPINNIKEDDTTVEEVFEITSTEREAGEQASQDIPPIEDHAREFNATDTTEEKSTENQVYTEAADLRANIVEKKSEEQASHSSSLVGEDTSEESSKQEIDYVVNVKEEKKEAHVECEEPIEVTDMVQETNLETLEESAEPKEDLFSPISEEEIHTEESKKTLVESNLFPSEVSEKDGSIVGNSDSVSGVVIDKPDLKEAEVENKELVRNVDLPKEDKGPATVLADGNTLEVADEGEEKNKHENLYSDDTPAKVYDSELVDKTVEQSFQVQSLEKADTKLAVDDESHEPEDRPENNNNIMVEEPRLLEQVAEEPKSTDEDVNGGQTTEGNATVFTSESIQEETFKNTQYNDIKECNTNDVSPDEKQDAVALNGEVLEESQDAGVSDSTTCETNMTAEKSEEIVHTSPVEYEECQQEEVNNPDSAKASKEEDIDEEILPVKVPEDVGDDSCAVVVTEPSAKVTPQGEEDLAQDLEKYEPREEVQVKTGDLADENEVSNLEIKDSFAVRTVEEASLQKEEHMEVVEQDQRKIDVDSTKELKETFETVSQSDSQITAAVPKDEIVADQAVLEGTRDIQLETPSNILHPKEEEVQTETDQHEYGTTTEGNSIEEEQAKEIEVPSDGNVGVVVGTRSREETFLQKEDPVELKVSEVAPEEPDAGKTEGEIRETFDTVSKSDTQSTDVVSKDETIAYQALHEGISKEGLQIESSALLPEEKELKSSEHEHETISEDKNKEQLVEEKEVPADKTTEELSAARSVEETCLQEEEIQELNASELTPEKVDAGETEEERKEVFETVSKSDSQRTNAVPEDEIIADQILLEGITDKQSQIPSYTLLPKEAELQTASQNIEEERGQEIEVNGGDLLAARSVEDTILQKEELQELKVSELAAEKVDAAETEEDIKESFDTMSKSDSQDTDVVSREEVIACQTLHEEISKGQLQMPSFIAHPEEKETKASQHEYRSEIQDKNIEETVSKLQTPDDERQLAVEDIGTTKDYDSLFIGDKTILASVPEEETRGAVGPAIEFDLKNQGDEVNSKSSIAETQIEKGSGTEVSQQDIPRVEEGKEISQDIKKTGETAQAMCESEIPTEAYSSERTATSIPTDNKDVQRTLQDSNVETSPVVGLDDTKSTSEPSKERTQVGTHLTEEKASTAASKEIPTDDEEQEHENVEEVKTDEEKGDTDSPIMVEASRDADVKASPKKSHNILSGIKHSISKVKKAITGKSSSHSKTHSEK